MLTKIKNLKIDKRLVYILALAAFFILVRISQVDFLVDNAHYAIRSLGFVDHVFSDQQTTPLYWYEHFPWWANFSFHDQPPLLFFIQHIFLLARESIFFAKLPYVLLSLGTVGLLYLICKKRYGQTMALWSALFLSLNSIFLYSARAGFMEAGVIFFIALAVYFFFKFLQNHKFCWALGLALGLCFLAKYSTFFLVPSFLVYIFVTDRRLFKNKQLYLAAALSILVFSPVLIYNVMMYKTTGHFDYQFSRLFHQASPWVAPGVAGVGNPLVLLKNYATGANYLYLFLALAGTGFALFKKKLRFFGLGLLFLILFFLFTGAAVQHQNLLNLFLAPGLGWLAANFSSKKVFKIFVWTTAVYFFLFAFNSHILIKPVLEQYSGWTVSAAPSVNRGIYQLDKYLDDLIERENIKSVRDDYAEIKSKKPSLKRKYGTKPEALEIPYRQYPQMIIYDDNLNWFAELWSFKRRRFYHNLPILSTEEFRRFLEDIDIDITYYIRATDNTYLESEGVRQDFPDNFEGFLTAKGVEPIDRIYRTDGAEAFRVYKIDAQYAR